jgi:methylenetetrahydrofolate dehydrogenase (NADP+) / methenyltetrahydrofolate cyclohydrolase
MADRFDKFTADARRALTLAQEEALQLNHNYIGTEHLLLGLTRASDTAALRVLGDLGVEPEAIRSRVESTIARGDRGVMGEIGLTPQAKKTIELAVFGAMRLQHRAIGTEHILLGLIEGNEGIAFDVLSSLGVTYDKARDAIVKPAVIIDGKTIAAEVREQAKQRADKLHERGITPGLALVLVGENPSSLSYVRSKGDAAEQAGIYSDMFHFPENTDQQALLSRILDLNEDGRFHAILVQLPLPQHLNENAIINAIDPSKDVDGVTPMSMGRLLRGEWGPSPATPAGVIELLHRTGHPPSGKHVVVCGRSNIVGKPIAALLMQKNDRANATVTLCHTGTQDLASITRQADILIAAMGVPHAITGDMVKPGVVVIDVGNNWIEDETRRSGRRLVGDVDFDSVKEVAAAITPVPGGVGPMTVAMLLSNTVMLAEQQAGRH